MTLQDTARRVAFDGISNFRDFGGWPTRDGRRVRQGLLFRSANHAAATPADLDRLAELGVSVVVDLRRPPERRREPSPAYPGSSVTVLHDRISVDDEAVAPHLAFLQNTEKGEGWVVEWLTDSYRNYPFDVAYTSIFRDYFQALAETDGGVVIHCAAGKDRTGFLCAITLMALGVDREAIEHDYLETNRLSNWEARIGPMLEEIERATGKPVDRDGLKAAMSADLRYLEAAFDALHAKHPDVDAYLEAVLEVTPALRERLRERLLVPA